MLAQPQAAWAQAVEAALEIYLARTPERARAIWTQTAAAGPETDLYLIPAQARLARVRTGEAVGQTILGTGRFQLAMLRRIRMSSEEHRAKQAPRRAVREVLPVWVLLVVGEERVQGAPDVVGD